MALVVKKYTCLLNGPYNQIKVLYSIPSYNIEI
jgi:hypothetical protein